jgi:uncharacterized protein with NRDE domain
VAANRDELLDRPALAMTVLQEAGPRILGGRDELAGGTWLAVNEAGVVAGLTNQPATNGRDPTRRSRGELPLALARHLDAAGAVEWLAASVRPSDYNPAWLLVGDRRSLFYVDLGDGEAPTVEPLPAGTHILENRPLGAPSPKVDHVRRLLGTLSTRPAPGLVKALERVLSDHEVPPGVDEERAQGVTDRPREVSGACVHAERYGTRSATVVVVPADRNALPQLWYTDGPPCVAPFRDAAWMWDPTKAPKPRHRTHQRTPEEA